MSTLVLVPSAKHIPVELQAEFGQIPSAMIPINCHPAFHYISECYPPDDTFLIAVNESGALIKDYCNQHMELQTVRVVDVGVTRSLAETVLTALEALETLPDQLVLHFADTAVGDPIPATGDFVFYSRPKDLYRWTVFALSDDQQITDIRDKNAVKNPDETPNAFIGVFGFANPQQYMRLLQNHLSSSADLDPLFASIRAYYNNSEAARFIAAEHWHDFGHLDTYYDSKKRLSEICRHFNTVTVDTLRGVISKRSQNAAKFIGEIEWYLKLPSPLQYIAPRIFNHSTDPDDAFIDMEFYGYPTLNDLYLFGNLDLGAWARIFNALEYVVSDMRRFKCESATETHFIASMHSMYEAKTLERIAEYESLDAFSDFRKTLRYDGRALLSLPEVRKVLHTVLEKAGIYDKPDFSIIHGDLCLSNILYDRRNGIVRLIDPRGRFGEFDIYGDYRYDRCKLSHSLCGDYDFLVNGLFDMQTRNGEVTLTPHINDYQKQVKGLYAESRRSSSGQEELKVRLLESLLFLSMVPLHKDRPKSQRAFVVRGLELFTAIAEKIV